ncbi:hypothetical protein [Acidovorax sp. BLS4]|uniref:hypothetical protein n=1 Tax=Acidovorax sp. BLS4 TaxID=3273430 RepID=UPI002942A4EA|nr:hypothetical protein [Paracidovorax avenae]WOI47725.1 hypothetical protein R1Z03_11130 [Paracidovorax avenae]
MIKQAMLLSTALLVAPAWPINKCKGPDGKVAFQDAPCPDGTGEKLRILAAPVAGGTTNDAQVRLDKMQRDNAVAEAIRMHKPLVGMTVDQLKEAMGPATKVNADNYNGTQREQVIYERPNETWYVYIRNGAVDSIQHRPGVPAPSSPARTTRCPTQHEINGAITSASSITLSEIERAERWKAIKQMQACGT